MTQNSTERPICPKCNLPCTFADSRANKAQTHRIRRLGCQECGYYTGIKEVIPLAEAPKRFKRALLSTVTTSLDTSSTP